MEEPDFAFTANETALVSISASDWLADSATMTHIAKNRSDFTEYMEMASEIEGITPGAALQTKGNSSVGLDFKVNHKIYSIMLIDVKHAPQAPNIILSIGRLVEHGHLAIFTGMGVKFKNKTGTVFGMGQKVMQMYQIRAWTKKMGGVVLIAATKARSIAKWHQILGHINVWSIKTLHQNHLVNGLKIDDSTQPTNA